MLTPDIKGQIAPDFLVVRDAAISYKKLLLLIHCILEAVILNEQKKADVR